MWQIIISVNGRLLKSASSESVLLGHGTTSSEQTVPEHDNIKMTY